MSTQHPLSLGEVKRLAGSADTIRLRAVRDADLETPIGAFLRLDDGVTRPTSSSRSRAASAWGATASWASARGGSWRSAAGRRGSRTARSASSSTRRTCPSPSSRPTTRWRPCARFVPRRTVEPTEGMPRFTGRRRRAPSPTTRSPIFEPTVPLPAADPVGVPLASFIETDLVLVFDHLTHTLAAIASLHTDAPRPGGALPDRRARPLRGPRADRPPQCRRDRGGAGHRPPALVAGDSARARDVAGPRGLRGRRPQREGRHRRRRGDPGRPGPAPVGAPAAPGRRPADRRDRRSTARCAR